LVCTGLCKGFWPFADSHPHEWPSIFDNSDWPPKSEAEVEFLHLQVDKEVAIGYYSQAFGPDLLPGMYNMPIHAVPKPGTNKHWLVTNHIAGKYTLNSMISHDAIAVSCMVCNSYHDRYLRGVIRSDKESSQALYTFLLPSYSTIFPIFSS
jgi:hypothetical protein